MNTLLLMYFLLGVARNIVFCNFLKNKFIGNILDIYNDHIHLREFVPVHAVFWFLSPPIFSPPFSTSSPPHLQKFV